MISRVQKQKPGKQLLFVIFVSYRYINKILEFSNSRGKTFDLITTKTTKFEFNKKMIVLSTDNTNTNFGGLNRKGKKKRAHKTSDRI